MKKQPQNTVIKVHVTVTKTDITNLAPDLLMSEPIRERIVLNGQLRDVNEITVAFRGQFLSLYFLRGHEEKLIAFEKEVSAANDDTIAFKDSVFAAELERVFKAKRTRHDRVIEMILKDAERSGFSREDMNSFHLDGFSKKTQSARIMELIRLAYHRGMARGVRMHEELSQPVVLHGSSILRVAEEDAVEPAEQFHVS